jgi:hypothetical protein
MDENAHDLMDLIERIIRPEIRRIDDLREEDKESVKLAYDDLTRKLEGFPQLFSTKEEVERVSETVQRLDKDTISREVYEQQHGALSELVADLDRDKMDESVFTTFVQDYRIAHEADATERRAIAQGLATTAAANITRQETSEALQRGKAATWKQIAAVVTVAITVLGFALTLIVLFANHKLG